jgi:DNA modification methylase
MTDAQDVARGRANDLDGTTWTRYSISVWSDISAGKTRNGPNHPAMFPVDLAGRLIGMFTRKAMTVLDPFAGTGSAIVAARDLGRHGIGVELNPSYVEIANERLSREEPELPPGSGGGSGVMHLGDARELDRFVGPGSVDLVVTSPPYWDILKEKRTADFKAPRDYGEDPRDIGTISDYDGFLSALSEVIRHLHTAVRDGGYCCFVVMDIRKKSRFYPLHSDLARLLEDAGFVFDDLIVWDRHQEYNNLRPLGFPAVFRVNKVHEFIVIARKLRPP